MASTARERHRRTATPEGLKRDAGSGRAARELLQAALLRDPNDPDILSVMGRVILRTDDTTEDIRRRLMPMSERIEQTAPGALKEASAIAEYRVAMDPLCAKCQ